MVDVKEAVSSATEFVKNLYKFSNLAEFMLEEVEISSDEQYWFVTFGFNRPHRKPEAHPLDILKSPQIVRVYKVIKVDAKTGQAQSMKIRET